MGQSEAVLSIREGAGEVAPGLEVEARGYDPLLPVASPSVGPASVTGPVPSLGTAGKRGLGQLEDGIIEARIRGQHFTKSKKAALVLQEKGGSLGNSAGVSSELWALEQVRDEEEGKRDWGGGEGREAEEMKAGSIESRTGGKRVRGQGRGKAETVPCSFLFCCLATVVSEGPENKKLPVKWGCRKLSRWEASGAGGLGTVLGETPCWQ